MNPKKDKKKIEQVIQAKLKDIEEARKRMIKYIVPVIILIFIILILFYFSMLAALRSN